MSMGDFALGTTIYKSFTTVTTTGAPTQLAGTPVLSVYENGGTTEITAGVSLTVDLDTRTGLNLATVVATSGNGFEAGKFYDIVITTGTVGGTSVVGYVVASFSIEAGAAIRPTTAGRTLDVTATGAAGIDFGNVENQSTSVNLSGTSVGTVASVTTVAADGITTTTLDATLLLRLGIVSYGVLDAGGAGAFTLPTGQRLNVSAGDMIHVIGKGARVIASGYNSTTGVGTTVSDFDSAAAASDAYNVIKLPKAEPLGATDFSDGFLTATKIATDAIDADAISSDAVTEIQSGLATAAALATVDTVVDSILVDTNAILVDTGTTLDARIPAALVGGRMDANVGAISADSVAADNAEAFFDGTGYAGTGNVIPTVSSVTAIATGGITAGSIAADAIGASELAADAVAEIQSGLALSTQVDALEAAAIAIEADTQDIQSRLPAALTAGGNIKADALAVSGDTVAADNLEAAADGTGYNLGGGSVVAASVTGAVGSVTGNVGGNLLGTLSTTERDAIAAALLDLAAGVETGLTMRQALRIISAATAGKLSGGGTATEVFRNAVADAKARITATVDASGNRTAITYDLT